MSRRSRRITEYAAACGVLVIMMAWLSVTAVREHREHRRSAAAAAYEKDLRLAMWRLETRVGAMLATIEVPTQAPEQFRAGILSCNSLDPLSGAVCGVTQGSGTAADSGWMKSAVDAADEAFDAGCSLDPEAAPQTEVDDLKRRAEVSRSTKRWVDDSLVPDGTMTVGPLATVWGRDAVTGEPDAIVLARRLQSGPDAVHESFRVQWAPLRDQLLSEIEGLVPAPKLIPIENRTPEPECAEPGARLASIPVRLTALPLDALPLPGASRGFLLSLMGAWGALAVALACGGVALRATLAYGDKHRRFTHAITHELRTPLTTFRMYSEMLRAGIVPEASRTEYFATLESESARLARLVENVLRYARIEDASGITSRTEVDVGRLLTELQGEFERLAAACSEGTTAWTIDVDAVHGVTVLTDETAVQQVLLNLVENACKYGRGGDGSLTVSIVAHLAAERVVIDVTDRGAGVPAEARRAIFEPFDRAGRDASDAAPGVGLGLALARGLARDLGGDLVLSTDHAATGASFRLTLPLSPAFE